MAGGAPKRRGSARRAPPVSTFLLAGRGFPLFVDKERDRHILIAERAVLRGPLKYQNGQLTVSEESGQER